VEVLQGRDEESAKTPATPICLGEHLLFEQMGEKGLCQVLRLMDVVNATTNIRIQGTPIRLAKLSQRDARFAAFYIPSGQHDVPLGCSEVPLSGCGKHVGLICGHARIVSIRARSHYVPWDVHVLSEYLRFPTQTPQPFSST